MTTEQQPKLYTPRVNRRTTLSWLAATMIAGASTACGQAEPPAPETAPPTGAGPESSAAAWPDLDLPQITAPGIGGDPNLVEPVTPWPLTMSERELQLAAALGDMIIPEDEVSPSASAVGAPDYINEWISAPYEPQQRDRELILNGLAWLDAEAQNRFGTGFVEATEEQKIEICDAIAFSGQAASGYEKAAQFFSIFRSLIAGGFYTTQAGLRDIGYQGNVAITDGPYPGPSAEAMTHLNSVLEELGLSL